MKKITLTLFLACICSIGFAQQSKIDSLRNALNTATHCPSGSQKSDTDYEPKVNITTQQMASGQLQIAISDNGNGIPEAIKAKIFQPFFTTKPTGQGTGLGLSLSYDIVKANGGELKVETK